MKRLVFEQITDSRFDKGNIKETLLDRGEKILSLLNDLPGVTATQTDFYNVNYDDSEQYRMKFSVSKTGRKTTWNDIYKTVNSVKAVPYKFN